MTDDEVINELKSDSLLNRCRLMFSSWCAKIEQAGQQRQPLSPIEMRRMEFAAVQAIAALIEGEHGQRITAGPDQRYRQDHQGGRHLHHQRERR